MTDENMTTKTTTADPPPAPNGHGASNGTTHGESLKTDAVPESAAKDAPPSSKKKKKKKRSHRHGKDAPPAQTETTTTPTTDTAPAAALEQVAPTEPIEATAEAPIEAPIEATAEAPIEAPIEATAEAPIEAPIEATAEAPIEAPIEATAPAEAPIEAPTENLRVRMKVWTDPTTSKRYLMPMAQMRDVVNGQPVSDVMYAYAMREGEPTKFVTLRGAEWNTLPFFYFQEDGPAPRATARPFDVAEGLRGKIP
jgi:hypothetical protein